MCPSKIPSTCSVLRAKLFTDFFIFYLFFFKKEEKKNKTDLAFHNSFPCYNFVISVLYRVIESILLKCVFSLCVLQFAPSLRVSENELFVEKIQDSCNFSAPHPVQTHLSSPVPSSACPSSLLRLPVAQQTLSLSVVSHIHTSPRSGLIFVF